MLMAIEATEKAKRRFVDPLATAISIMKKKIARSIESNIEKYGFHVYDVLGGPLPPWLYTIGLSEQVGFELIFAGGLYFQNGERSEIVDKCAEAQMSKISDKFECSMGSFCLCPVSASWPEELFLGAIGYYSKKPRFLQIYPDDNWRTNEVPRLFDRWSASKFPAWRWLEEEWIYPIPAKSWAATDTDMLGGHAKAEVACRFKNDFWEIYSRQPEEIEEQYKRLSPLGTLLALHDDIEPVIDLKSGQAIERVDGKSDWIRWSGFVGGGEQQDSKN